MSELINKKAEASLLGCLIRSEQQFWNVQDKLRADMFAHGIHPQIYQAIADIHAEGKKLSINLLTARLPEEDDEGQNTAAYIIALVANSEELNAEDFADDVAECAGRRQIIKIAEAAAKAARAGTKPVLDIAASIEESTIDIIHKVSPKRPRLIYEIARGVSEKAITAKRKDVLPGIRTGLDAVDEITGLWMPGDLIFLLGSQGDGKSALAAQIAAYNAQYGPVLILQNEMTEEQLAARELASNSGVPVRILREGAFDAFQMDKIKNSVESLKSSQLWIMNDPKMSIRSIKNHALAIKRTHGLNLLVVDQLTHIRTDIRHRNKFDRYEEITSEAKSLAFELECPVLILVQRTRRAQRDEDPTPKIDDADANSIERDGDTVLAVWREITWLRRNKPNPKASGEAWDEYDARCERVKNKASVIALKVRSGEPFQQRDLKWNGAMTRFTDFNAQES